MANEWQYYVDQRLERRDLDAEWREYTRTRVELRAHRAIRTC